jgi:ribonucleotide reductase class II
MTPNHRLSIDGNWIYASDMTPGMKIDFSLGEYQNTQETPLLDIDQFSYTREARQLEAGHNRGITATIIKMPKTMSPDLAYFIGALFGNGCLSISGHRIRFSSNSYKLLERLQQIAQNLFVVDGKINKYSDRAAYELSISSVQLYNWLQLTGIAKTEKSLNLDRIPLAIRCSSKQSILSFFCGLIDTDGCIRSNGSMSIDSASEDFIRNLQQIGEAVGLCFSIFHNTQGKNNQAQKSMWGLCLSRMLSKPDALDYLNKNSQKAEIRPIPSLKRNYKFDPYLIESVEWEETPDYSYDFAVQGEDDNDSWYWQGGIKSHNTKSLLTGASPGWHPPKAQQFIRRITFRKNDPVALACIDFGYSVVPSQSDKDENGNLLDNPFDERCTEWLVEIPVAVSWANLPGVDVDISKFSVLAQFDFYMQVQKYYTTHNTSATLELRQNEIGALSRAIYDSIENNDGYISAAILSRFDDFQSYPRLPFEPISKDKYLQLVKEVNQRKTNDDFLNALHKYDNGFDDQSGPAPCDSDKCLLPESK